MRVANRRDRFRDFMARLDPSDSATALVSGSYVAWPGQSLADKIRLKAELLPSAAQLVVGGIGSGKTTQLLAARQAIEGLGDTRALYVDFAKEFDLEGLRTGALVALVGLELASKYWSDERLPRPVAVRRMFECAYGKSESEKAIAPEQAPQLRRRFHQGVHAARNATRDVYALLPPQPTIVLIDSLDRVTDTAAFEGLVRQDVSALREIGIGVVLAGPLSLLFGARRALLDGFDAVHHLPTVDVGEPGGVDFLVRLLRARADQALLPDDVCAQLARLSGGVPRDLISLARAAGEEAYVGGSDMVRPEHALKAADGLGRRLAFGLSELDRATLERINKTGRFVEASDGDVALLVTRRVLERDDATDRFIVHPALAPLLRASAA